MPQYKRSKAAASSVRKDPAVTDLILPIVAFLRRSGMTQRQLNSEFRAAMRLSYSGKPGVKVVRIGVEHLGLTIVSRWLRDPMYLNHAGRPADLPLTGRRSIRSLIKECRINLPVSKVIAFLIEFGTVKKLSPSRYRLVQRSLNFAIPNYLPFEPNLQFLIDAARAATWGSALVPKLPRLFWHNAVSTNVERQYHSKFLRFAKERSLQLMHEMNEWLEAHETLNEGARFPIKGIQESNRIGVGLFGIYSGSK
jgi:hypothetical protein